MSDEIGKLNQRMRERGNEIGFDVPAVVTVNDMRLILTTLEMLRDRPQWNQHPGAQAEFMWGPRIPLTNRKAEPVVTPLTETVVGLEGAFNNIYLDMRRALDDNDHEAALRCERSFAHIRESIGGVIKEVRRDERQRALREFESR